MTLDTSKIISQLLQDRSVPEYIKNDYPTFISFLTAYLEWMEEEKNAHDIALHLRDYRNIDNTLDEFVDYFRKELLVNIPTDILADKRLLAKQIKEFYLNKGNEASYRFLFRILYDENIEFYYPKVDILRASDGKWYEQKSLKITINDPDILYHLTSTQITGNTSGASAIVESVLRFTEREEDLIEISLSNIRGTFQSGETITITYTDDDGEEQEATETILEVYNGITITGAGSAYSVGDEIPVKDGNDVEIATATITKTTKGPVNGLTIDEAGTGYNGTVKWATKMYALPMEWTLELDSNTSIYLPDYPVGLPDSNNPADSNYVEDSNYIDFASYTFDQVIPLQIISGTGDEIEINDSSNSFGTGAFGVVSKVGNDDEILEVTLSAPGDGYDGPTAEVISETGTGAVILVSGGGGAVETIKMNTFPIVLDTDEDSNGYVVYPDFTSQGDGNATGTMTVGALAEYPGRWLNEDGMLSSSKRLQDNLYYQEYSYVIKVGLSINKWRDILKKIVHPAGLAVFGEIGFVETLSNPICLAERKLTRNIITTAGTATAVMTEAVIKLYTNDSNGEANVPVLDSNGNHLIDWDKDSSGQYVQT